MIIADVVQGLEAAWPECWVSVVAKPEVSLSREPREPSPTCSVFKGEEIISGLLEATQFSAPSSNLVRS